MQIDTILILAALATATATFVIYCLRPEVILNMISPMPQVAPVTVSPQTETKPVENTDMQSIVSIQTELDKLILDTKGRFFSITFNKNDGTSKVVNGKDFYRRLIKGNGGENVALRSKGFVSMVDRNREDWCSVNHAKVITFKCGEIQKTFTVA